jgi:hypothetical protein
MMKTFSILLGIVSAAAGLTIGGWSSPACAIEMFTNFNNGMELGFRPLGIPEFEPVRYHSWQPHGWYERHGVSQPCGNGQLEDNDRRPYHWPITAVPAHCVPGNQSQDEPTELHGEPIVGDPANGSDPDESDSGRSESFLPRFRAN